MYYYHGLQTVGQTQQQYEQLRQKYIIGMAQRKVSENMANDLIQQMQRPWPEPSAVRFDRWWDRKNHGFMGDKPNRWETFGKGAHSATPPDYQRMEITGATKVYGWPQINFQGTKTVYPPGNHGGSLPRSIAVLPAVDFESILNQVSDVLSKFAQFEYGCLLTVENVQTHPLVLEFIDYVDRIKELFKGSPLEEEYEEKKQRVLLGLSEDILRQTDCRLLSVLPTKNPSAPVRREQVPCQITLTDQQQRSPEIVKLLTKVGFVPIRPGCWVRLSASREGVESRLTAGYEPRSECTQCEVGRAITIGGAYSPARLAWYSGVKSRVLHSNY